MSDKAKTKSVDPRKAMRKVRADVKRILASEKMYGMNHLGEYPKNMEDAVRTIIAVQDLYEAEKASHDKATKHVAALIDRNSATEELVSRMSMDSFFNTAKFQSVIGDLKDHCAEQDRRNTELRTMIGQQRDTEDRLVAQVMQLERERKSLKETVAIFAGDNT